MNRDIYEDIYNEFRGVTNRMMQISKEIESLHAKREALQEIETELRCILLDYGDIRYERYEPKEEG